MCARKGRHIKVEKVRVADSSLASVHIANGVLLGDPDVGEVGASGGGADDCLNDSNGRSCD